MPVALAARCRQEGPAPEGQEAGAHSQGLGGPCPAPTAPLPLFPYVWNERTLLWGVTVTEVS